MIKAMLIAGAGGFVGTCGRYLICRWSAGVYHGSFPVGTFLVNILGCFIIGLLFGLFERYQMLDSKEHIVMVTGFCGGLTTFSSFAYDLWALGQRGEWLTFVFYLTLSVVLGLVAVWIGRSLIS